MSKPIYLLTGHPGVGKSTIILSVIKRLGNRAGGFYTRELRVDGKRAGFEVVTLDGTNEMLATKNQNLSFPRQVKFESYLVNLNAMDVFAVPAIQRAVDQGKTLIIDEIGPMEIFSQRFCQLITDILEMNGISLIGSIVERPYEFADQVKVHPRVQLLHVTVENREQLMDDLICFVEARQNE